MQGAVCNSSAVITLRWDRSVMFSLSANIAVFRLGALISVSLILCAYLRELLFVQLVQNTRYDTVCSESISFR
jgi:hypothetical protein